MANEPRVKFKELVLNEKTVGSIAYLNWIIDGSYFTECPTESTSFDGMKFISSLGKLIEQAFSKMEGDYKNAKLNMWNVPMGNRELTIKFIDALAAAKGKLGLSVSFDLANLRKYLNLTHSSILPSNVSFGNVEMLMKVTSEISKYNGSMYDVIMGKLPVPPAYPYKSKIEDIQKFKSEEIEYVVGVLKLSKTVPKGKNSLELCSKDYINNIAKSIFGVSVKSFADRESFYVDGLKDSVQTICKTILNDLKTGLKSICRVKKENKKNILSFISAANKICSTSEADEIKSIVDYSEELFANFPGLPPLSLFNVPEEILRGHQKVEDYLKENKGPFFAPADDYVFDRIEKYIDEDNVYIRVKRKALSVTGKVRTEIYVNESCILYKEEEKLTFDSVLKGSYLKMKTDNISYKRLTKFDVDLMSGEVLKHPLETFGNFVENLEVIGPFLEAFFAKTPKMKGLVKNIPAISVAMSVLEETIDTSGFSIKKDDIELKFGGMSFILDGVTYSLKKFYN